MKNEITLPVAELKEALPGLTKVIGKSRTLPVLQSVRIARNREGIVCLHATDLDSFLSYTTKDMRHPPDVGLPPRLPEVLDVVPRAHQIMKALYK